MEMTTKTRAGNASLTQNHNQRGLTLKTGVRAGVHGGGDPPTTVNHIQRGLARIPHARK